MVSARELAHLSSSLVPHDPRGWRGDKDEQPDLEILAERAYAGSDLAGQLTLRALTTLSPPEQGWDRYKDTYSSIAEPGYLATRVAALEALVADHALAESVPGDHAHCAHRQHLAGSTIEGKAVRARCGVYFRTNAGPRLVTLLPNVSRTTRRSATGSGG